MANVLIVEDNPPSVALYQAILRSDGHTNIVATNGEEALAVLNDNPSLDLMLVDYNVPKINGYKFLTEVRTNSAYSQYAATPAIGVGDFPPEKQEYLVACIPKPVNVIGLIGYINKALGQSGNPGGQGS